MEKIYLDIEGKLRRDGELIDFNTDLDDYDKEKIIQILNSDHDIDELVEAKSKLEESEEQVEDLTKTNEAYANFMNNMCREFRELVPQLLLTLYNFDEIASDPEIAPELEAFFEDADMSTKWNIDSVKKCILKLSSFGSTFAVSHPTNIDEDDPINDRYEDLYKVLRPIISKSKIKKSNE